MTRKVLPKDPLAGATLSDLISAVRRRELTASALVQTYLERIALLDPQLGAFEHVAWDIARAEAAECDRRLSLGEDVGPLAGLPIAVKDLFVVDGMPTGGGSNLDVSAMLTTGDGPVVARLRAAGAIVLGKTRTVEFAFGASGISLSRGTPWNPADAREHRIPGGSSSGSAVAVAAGLAAFALGSDTGGSVRIPAALCGIFGLKTSLGHWATEGVLPLSPTFDTVGLLSRSAADAAVVFELLSDARLPPAPDLAGLRFAEPSGYDLPLEPEVDAAFQAALDKLRGLGVTFGPVEMAEASERADVFPVVLATELMDRFGADRFARDRGSIDPVVAKRMERGLQADRTPYDTAITRHAALTDLMAERLAGFDGWVSPTTAVVAPVTDAFEDVERGLQLTLGITCYTQPGNLFGQCAVTLPLSSDKLPIGFQISASAGLDAELLAIALGLEAVFGQAAPRDMSDFLAGEIQDE